MRVDIHELMQEMGMDDNIQPGKRILKKLAQPGQYKNHTVVADWLDPKKIVFSVKAGLKGGDLPPKELKNYPVSFQSPTFFEIKPLTEEEAENPPEVIEFKAKEDVVVDTKSINKTAFEAVAKDGYVEDESGEGDETGSFSGSDEDITIKDLHEFSSAAEGFIADVGDITKMVVMGMEIAQTAFEGVLNAFVDQVNSAKISCTNILSAAGNYITKYMPPAFMDPTGDETANYEYSVEKNSTMFTGPSFT